MNKLAKLIQEANRIVVFSGAGFSTESGIADFRSKDGLYKNQSYSYPAEVMLSHSFYRDHPHDFYEFYKNEMIHLEAKANHAHRAISALEKQGKLEAVITQNIDGLHQAGGVSRVLELHGSIHRNYCENCHTFYDVHYIMSSKDIPYCKHCGGMIKPDVVLYEEGLDEKVVKNAIQALQKADLLIVAGTSLVVYPAAGLLEYYQGKEMVLINKEVTTADQKASLVLHEKIGDVLAFMNE